MKKHHLQRILFYYKISLRWTLTCRSEVYWQHNSLSLTFKTLYMIRNWYNDCLENHESAHANTACISPPENPAYVSPYIQSCTASILFIQFNFKIYLTRKAMVRYLNQRYRVEVFMLNIFHHFLSYIMIRFPPLP